MINRYQAMARFAQYFWRESNGRIGIGVLLNLVGTLVESFTITLLIPLIGSLDRSMTSGGGLPMIGKLLPTTSLSLEALLTIFVALVSLQFLFTRIRTLYLGRMVHEITDEIRVQFLQNIGMANWDSINQHQTADLSFSLGQQIDRVRLALGSLLGLIQSSILLLIYFVLASLVSWQMALFAVGIGFVLVVLLYPVRRRASEHGRQLSDLGREKEAIQLEFLTGLRVAKSFVAEKSYTDRFGDQLHKLRENTLRFISVASYGTLFFQISSAVAAALFVWIAVAFIQLDIARLLILLLIFVRLAPRFLGVQDTFQLFLTNLPAFESVLSHQAAFEDDSETLPEMAGGDLQGDINICAVSLTYRGAAEPALRDVSFTIKENEITALIGPSGSGKSSLADIIMGLMRPSGGQLRVGAVPIEANNRRAWRDKVAHVPQEPFLLNDTIAANLRIAAPEANDNALRTALDRANALAFVDALPDGLNTRVGERGTRFSGGERQRLSLARALLKEPELLILDEATSALDWENQKAIAADIVAMRGHMTILTIAHRPSMIDFADNVIALDCGIVVEAGRFDTLAASKDSRLQALLRAEDAHTPDQ